MKFHALLNALVVVGLIGMPNTAFGEDVYNFYFKKPKPEGQDNGFQVNQPSDPVQQQPIQQPAQQPTITPNNPNNTSQTVTVPSGQQPIVIHNINNVGTPGQTLNADGSTSAAPMVTVQPPPYIHNAQGPTITPIRTRPRWRLGLGAMVFFNEVSTNLYDTGSYYRASDPEWAGVLSASYNFSRKIGITGFLGAFDEDDAIFGVEFDWFPLQIPVRSDWDIIELGLTAGFSNARDSAEVFDKFHLGAKLHVNVVSDFSITGAVRANKDYLATEIGFATRL